MKNPRNAILVQRIMGSTLWGATMKLKTFTWISNSLPISPVADDPCQPWLANSDLLTPPQLKRPPSLLRRNTTKCLLPISANQILCFMSQHGARGRQNIPVMELRWRRVSHADILLQWRRAFWWLSWSKCHVAASKTSRSPRDKERLLSEHLSLLGPTCSLNTVTGGLPHT